MKRFKAQLRLESATPSNLASSIRVVSGRKGRCGFVRTIFICYFFDVAPSSLALISAVLITFLMAQMLEIVS